MKPVILILLAGSLAGNVALAIYSYHQETKLSSLAARTETFIPTGSTPNAGSAANDASSANIVLDPNSAAAAAPSWRGVRSESDMKNVVAGLRAAGYPPSILRAVVNQMLSERAELTDTDADQPFWKRSRPSAESVAAQQARDQELVALREELLGADGAPAAMLSAKDRARRFGTLSDEKVSALLKLDREYNDVRMMSYAAIEEASGRRNMGEQMRALESEKRADLEAMLTPAELEQYDMRTSRTAQQVQHSLRNIDVTEAEYARLYQIQKANEAATPARGELNGIDGMANRIVGQSETNEHTRAVLGDERFFKYLETADSTYAQVARLAQQYPQITKDTAYQVYQLRNELMLTMAAGRGAQQGPPTEQRMQAMREATEAFNARLQSLVGPEAAEAYRQSPLGRNLGGGVTFRPGRN
jgi:hypothetical protein